MVARTQTHVDILDCIYMLTLANDDTHKIRNIKYTCQDEVCTRAVTVNRQSNILFQYTHMQCKIQHSSFLFGLGHARNFDSMERKSCVCVFMVS